MVWNADTVTSCKWIQEQQYLLNFWNTFGMGAIACLFQHQTVSIAVLFPMTIVEVAITTTSVMTAGKKMSLWPLDNMYLT